MSKKIEKNENILDQYPVFKLRNKLINTQREFASNFLSKVITITDASIINTEQRRAIKDLIEEAFWESTEFNTHCKTIIYDFFEKYEKESLPSKEVDRLALKGQVDALEGERINMFDLSDPTCE